MLCRILLAPCPLLPNEIDTCLLQQLKLVSGDTLGKTWEFTGQVESQFRHGQRSESLYLAVRKHWKIVASVVFNVEGGRRQWSRSGSRRDRKEAGARESAGRRLQRCLSPGFLHLATVDI